MIYELPPLHSVLVPRELEKEAIEKIESKGFVVYATSAMPKEVRISFAPREFYENKMCKPSQSDSQS